MVNVISSVLSVLFLAVDSSTLWLEKVARAGGSIDLGPCCGLVNKTESPLSHVCLFISGKTNVYLITFFKRKITYFSYNSHT